MDFEKRKHDYNLNTEPRVRRAPTAADYRESEAKALLYSRLSLSDWHPGLSVAEEASWEGDPMAAFQSSFRAVADERMPLELKKKLYHFSRLLDEHDLESSKWTNRTQTVDNQSITLENDSSEDDEKDHDRAINNSTKRMSSRCQIAFKDGARPRGGGSRCSLRSQKRSTDLTDDFYDTGQQFVYGPCFTADRCMKYILDLRQQSRAV